MNRHRLLNLIDRERTSLERIGRHAAERIGLQARIQAIRAIKVGADPVVAVHQALWGNERLGLSGIVKLLADAMVAGHLQGRRRSLLIAAPQMRAKDGWKLAGSAFDEAIAFLRKRLNLSQFDIASIEQRYASEAIKVTSTLSRSLEQRVQQTIIESTQQGYGVREGVRELRKAFDLEGFVPSNSYVLENTFRTQVQMGYGAGRWQANQDPAIQEIIESYTYSTVGDDRVRPSHELLDGMTRPHTDPVWLTLWVPNGYSCRCSILENFSGSGVALTDVPEGATADPGFNFNAGRIWPEHSA